MAETTGVEGSEDTCFGAPAVLRRHSVAASAQIYTQKRGTAISYSLLLPAGLNYLCDVLHKPGRVRDVHRTYTKAGTGTAGRTLGEQGTWHWG